MATRLEIIEVTNGLIFAPGAKGMSADGEQIGFCPAGKRNVATA